MKGRLRPRCIHLSYISCLLAAHEQFLLYNGCSGWPWLGGRGALAVCGDAHTRAHVHCRGKRGGVLDTCHAPPPAQSSGTAALGEHIKSKTQRWPCSMCQARRRGYGGIHQSASAATILITPSPDPSLRSLLSPSPCLSNHISHSPL